MIGEASLFAISVEIVRIGFVFLFVSIFLFLRRTRDWTILISLWRPRSEMTRAEFSINRIGLVLVCGGFAVILILVLFDAPG